MMMLSRRRMTCVLFMGALAAKAVTWTTEIPAAAPLPQDLWLRSSSGTAQFDLMLGAGGAVSVLRANAEANKPLLATSLSIVDRTIQWGLMAGTTIDDGDSATDDRFYVRQSGGFGERISPIMQIVTNATTSVTDIYSVPQDQWAKHLRTKVQGKFSSLTRYEPLSDGSIKIRRVIHLGAATTNGAPFVLENPYFENLNTFHVANFNALATQLKSNGGLEVYYHQGYNIPQDPQTDVTATTGYAVVYNRDDTVNRAALGVVFGKLQPTGGHQCIVNYSDGTDNITVRPGLRISTVPAGSILDLTYYLVPGYGLNSALVTRLNTLVAATPAPVVYAPGYAFSGELATIVQSLTNNLSVAGLRSDRLGGDVVIPPIVARPMLLSGPENDDYIREGLTIFYQGRENLMQNYLYGTDAEKLAANTYFFRYPGSIDGNGLLESYVPEMSRAMMWAHYRYDIALGLGKSTQAQRDLMKRLSEEFMAAKCPVLPIGKRGGGNLSLETFIAMGLCGLNFPELPESQLWVSRSADWVRQEMDTYFPDGAGTESPRYHEWVHEMISKYLYVLKRRTGVDLFDHRNVRASIEWVMRYTSPPLSVINSMPVLPAWGDTTYSSWSQVLYYYDLAIFAPAYKDRDPAFAARLMSWWRKTGSTRSPTSGAGGLTNLQILDPRMEDSPQKVNSSTYSPYHGHAVLRPGDGSSDEMLVTFKCGRNGVHNDADQGTFDMFAFGVPLVLDSASGPYITGTTWSEIVPGHNTVRFNGSFGSDSSSGTFNAFGSSDVADYVVAKNPYGTVSTRHMVFVKPDYLVVWDETDATSYADWYLHVPGSSTLEWQPRKVVSHTAWNVDLDVHIVLPAANLPAPVTPCNLFPTLTGYVTNTQASAASDPLTAGMFTTQGESHFGEWYSVYSSRNPFDFHWLKFFSVRNAPDRQQDFVTVLHPRKVGVTPAITPTLVSSSSTGVTLSIAYNGRTDTIVFTTTGATVTKGSQPAVQFTKTYPQSGVSGAAGLVKADLTATTTLSTALTTTGPVTVDIGTLALGGNNRIPDSVPLTLSSCGVFDLNGYSDTVGALTMNGGLLTGSGTLTCSSITWWGGKVAATLVSTGAFTKKDGIAWSPTSTISYAGDTIIEDGTLRFGVGGPGLSGTGKIVLSSGATLDLNGSSQAFAAGDLTAPAGSTITTGSGTLTLTGGDTNTILAAFSGNLVHAGTGLATFSGAFGAGTTLAVQTGASLGLGSQNGAALTAVNGSTVVLNGVFTAGSGSTVSGAVTGTGSLVATTGTTLTLSATTTLGAAVGLGVNGTGTLSIPAGTTLTVPFLTIDGVLQAAGTYTSTTLISGGGSLVVSNGMNVPAGLSVSTATGRAVLNWSGVAGASGYRVKRAATSGGPYTVIGTSASTTYTDDSAISGTVFYVVSATNEYGETLDSSEVQAYLIRGVTFTAAVASGARIWLDATRDDRFIQSGGAVSRWHDARSNGNYLYQSLATSQPTWHGDADLAGPATSVVDFGPYTYGTTSGMWMQANTEFADIRTAFWVGNSTMENHLFGNTATYDFHTGGTTLWSSQYASSSIRGGTTWLDGVVINGTTTALPPTFARVTAATTGNVRINTLARDRTYRTGGMQIGEAILFNAVLDTTQRQNVETYLAYKWFGSGAGIGNLMSTQTLAMGGGGVLDLSGENYQTLDALSATDGSGVKIRLGAARLTVGDSSSTTFDGVITGAGGSLVKTGSGTLTLTGASSYTGGSTVNAGTLTLSGSGTLGTGNLIVANGATCSIQTTSGAVADPASVYLGSTGSLALGTGVGELVQRLYINGVLQMAGTWYAARDAAHFSGSGSLVVAEGAVAAPTGLTAAMVSSSAINLSWSDNATGETGYTIERSLTAGSGFVEIASLTSNTTSYADSGRESNTTYHYRVCAFNDVGDSAYTAEASATTRLATPAGLSAIAGVGQVTLSWTAVPGATSYTLKRSLTSGGATVDVSTSAISPFLDSGLNNETPYYYIVVAVNANGASADSAEAVAIPSANPQNNGTWTSLVSGNWSSAGNWASGIIAAGADRTATFSQAATVTVTQDIANRTIGNIDVTAGTYTLAGGPITLSATSGISTFNVVSTATISAPLAGSGSVVKTATGTLILSGANSFAGNLTLNAGSLWFSTGARLAASTTIYAGDTSGSSAATLTWANNGLSINNTVVVRAGSAGTKSLVVNDGVTGNISSLTLNTDVSVIKASGTGSLVVGGATTLVGGTRTINMLGGTMNLAGSVGEGGAGYGLTKTGVGTLVLSGSNTYSGTTTVSVGVLSVRKAFALGATSAGTVVANNARLELEGNVAVASEPITLTGTGGSSFYTGALNSKSGSNTWNGTLTFAASGTRIGCQAGATLDIAGQINSAYGINIRNDTGGTVVISGVSSYSGDTAVVAGTLRLRGGANRLPVTTKAVLGGSDKSGVFDLNGWSQELAGISIAQNSGTYNNEIKSATVATLTVNAATDSTFTLGKITGAIALLKRGVGQLTLGGANTYNGGTTVMGGTLVVSGSGKLGAGSLTVGENATCDLQSAAVIADTAIVSLATTGMLKLATGVSETVARLYLDDVLQAAGTYTSNSLPAYLTGSGTLVVTDGLPIAPSAVTPAVLNGRISLTWTDNAVNETGYAVERSLVADSGFSVIATLAAGATTYSDDLLDWNTTYHYRVCASNAWGNSAYSGVVSATTPPPAPANLMATAGDAQASLSWDATEGATSYTVKRATVSGGAYATLASPATPVYTDTTAVNGTTYYYVVSAVNVNGESAHSVEASARPLPPAGNGVWTRTTSGAWSLHDNWQSFVIGGGIGKTATFSQATGVIVTQDVAGLTLGHLIFGTSGTIIQGSELTLDADTSTPSVAVAAAKTATLAVALAGSAGLTKADAGTLTLSGTNSYTGVTTLGGGIVNVATLSNYGEPGALGARTAAQELSANIGIRFMGGTLQYTGATAQSTDRQIRIGTAGGTLDASGSTTDATLRLLYSAANTDLFDTPGARTLTLTGSNTGTNTLAIRLTDQNASTGKTSLTKTGAGTWILSGSSSYSGGTLFGTAVGTSSGILRLANSNALGTGTLTINNGNTDTGTVELTGDITIANTINFFGRTSGTTGAIIRNYSGTNTLGGVLTGSFNGSSYNIHADSGTLNITNRITTSSASRTLTLRGAGNITITGKIENGTGSMSIRTWGDGGVYTLSGANTYTLGTTLVAGNDQVNLNHASALGSGTFTINGGKLDNTGSGALTLSTNNGQNWNGNFTFVGTRDLNLGSGAVTMNASRTVTVTAGTLTVGGAIAGSGFALAKAGNGTLTLAGANTYSGGTTVTSGTLKIATATALPASGTVALSEDATLDLAGGSPIAAPAMVASLTCSGGRISLATSDRLNITGDLTGTVRFTIADPHNLVASQSYILATYSGTPPAAVLLDGLAFPWIVRSSSGEIRLYRVNGTLFSVF